jgi:hypothetical protein
MGLYLGFSGQLDSLEKVALCMNWNADETVSDKGNAFTCTCNVCVASQFSELQ